MQLNQARNLTSLSYSSLQAMQQSLAQTQKLLRQAERIAYDIQQINHADTKSAGGVALLVRTQGPPLLPAF